MEMPLEALNWQKLLGKLIEKPSVCGRLAVSAHVRPVTLQRWARNISQPRKANLQTLLNALAEFPQEEALAFMQALQHAFPALRPQQNLASLRIQHDLPPDFYGRLFAALTLTPQPMCRQKIQELVLYQALHDLDSEHTGITMNLVCCMPPRLTHSNKVRSLREISGLGTFPWQIDPAQSTMFLGAESLIGYVVMQQRPLVINSKQERTFFPANWTKHECSVAAFPILHQARIAGGFLVSSCQENFFAPELVALLERYSFAASLIFEPHEFYAQETIELGIMPSEQIQIPYFHEFNRRTSQKFADALTSEQPITLGEARQHVWQDLEDELLSAIL